MTRLVGWAWEIFTAWSLAAVGLAACFDRYRRRQRRKIAAARKRAVLHSSEHSAARHVDSGGHAHLMKRPRRDTCPQCGATEQQWCHPGCPLLDPMDYR